MGNSKSCCFIGHRKIKIDDNLVNEVTNVIEKLILNDNVSNFLFGSKSEFDNLCHQIVTDLKEKYNQIIRINYTCSHETFISENQRERYEKLLSNMSGKQIRLKAYEKECEFKSKFISGKASYIERNKAMIDDSDYCVFYYDEKFVPFAKTLMVYHKRKSGTAIAYKYAKRKNKMIYNLFSK
ncbi:MAG: DUF1273 family protein [Clostridia bacterium]|nr:DUF1273 family protein [Clostridia bacterium]